MKLSHKCKRIGADKMKSKSNHNACNLTQKRQWPLHSVKLDDKSQTECKKTELPGIRPESELL